MCYVCDAVSFANHVNVKGCAILGIKACADDRLLRPNSNSESVWAEFANMKEGKDYIWTNPWNWTNPRNSEIMPFASKKSAFEFASANCTLTLKTQECGNCTIAMAFRQNGELYFFYRIRTLEPKEVDMLAKQFKSYKSKYERLSRILSKIKNVCK